MSCCRIFLVGYLLLWPALLVAQIHKPAAPSEWERTVDLAKKEARVVVSVPTSAELRKEFETGFQKAFPGIELELNAARGAGANTESARSKNQDPNKLQFQRTHVHRHWLLEMTWAFGRFPFLVCVLEWSWPLSEDYGYEVYP